MEDLILALNFLPLFDELLTSKDKVNFKTDGIAKNFGATVAQTIRQNRRYLYGQQKFLQLIGSVLQENLGTWNRAYSESNSTYKLLVVETHWWTTLCWSDCFRSLTVIHTWAFNP